MAQALPSFVELLASLDLESDESPEVQYYARYPTSPSFISSSPSSSLPSSGPSSQTSPRRFLTSPGPTSSFNAPSPSIIISHPSPVEDLVGFRRRRNSNRYNPYVAVPQNVFARRRSLPGGLDHPHDEQDENNLTRASSASPPMRRASLGEPVYENGARSSPTRIAMAETDQPISTFVRRRHPHNPSQSPEISKARHRSVSPTDTTLIPVSLPSLPPLPPISASTNTPVPSYPHTGLLPITALHRRSSTPSADLDPGSEDKYRTPKPASRKLREPSSVDLGANRISQHGRAAHKHNWSTP